MQASETAGSEVSDAQDSGADAAGTVSSEETPAVREPLPLLTEYLTEEEYAKADQWAASDDSAVAAVMRRAEEGNPVTIAVIGGSITQGTISNGSKDSEVPFRKSYAELFEQWWTERFPEGGIDFINAGIGGTDSYLGVHRLDMHVMQYLPDLVLVEYSVNDADNITYKKSYENLVRNIMYSEAHPAVMLLFMGQTNGSNAQGSHVMVGYNYSLPMLSYASAISVMMDQGHFSAEELSGDVVHPSSLGHAITGEILWRYLNYVYEHMYEYPEPEVKEIDPLTSWVYKDADIIDPEKAEIKDLGTFTQVDQLDWNFWGGWENTEGDGGIEFEASFRNLGILYIRTTDGKSGQFDILIDGENVRTIDGDFSGGWGNAITGTEVFTSDEAAKHTVKIVRNSESEGEQFKLLGLMVS